MTSQLIPPSAHFRCLSDFPKPPACGMSIAHSFARPLHWPRFDRPREFVRSHARRMPLLAGAALCVICALFFLLVDAFFSLRYSEPQIIWSSDAAAPLHTWTDIVYHPFTRPSSAAAIADISVRPIHSHLKLSDACLEQWVARGHWEGACARVRVEEPIIDLVYVWVNGS